MTKSQEIQAKAERYNKIERVADSWGRMIGVRRLKPSEKMRIEEMTPNLDGDIKFYDNAGKEFAVSRRAPLALAASVCELDGNPIFFPRKREELDAIYDRLDEEGMAAVVKALAKLGEDTSDYSTDPVDEAKNSAGDPS